VLLAAIALHGGFLRAQMPWFAREAFHGNSRTLGLLVGRRRLRRRLPAWSISPRGPLSAGCCGRRDDGALAGAALVVFSFSKNALARAAALYVVGMSSMLVAASTIRCCKASCPMSCAAAWPRFT